MNALARLIQFLERDDVFGPLQIVILPAILFRACIVGAS